MAERRDPLSPNQPDSSREERPLRALMAPASLSSERVRRRVIAGSVVAVVVCILGWTLISLGDRAVGWLNSRPDYAVPFSAIELEPVPPPSIRSGADGILSQVKARAGIADPIPFLHQDLNEIAGAFAKYSPWVEKVESVQRIHPKRLVVHLKYRVPVARIDDPKDSNKCLLVVSADGVALASDDVKASVIKQLIPLKGLSPLPDPLPGRFLGADRDGKISPRISAAVKLAAFLNENDRSSARSGRIEEINLAHPETYVRTKRKFWVFWNHAPGEETEDEPKAIEKLERSAQWEDAHQDTKPDDDHLLVFTKDSIAYLPGVRKKD